VLFARIFAVLRGLLGLVFAVCLVVMPEQMMPGSSADPARLLALFFASRLLLWSLGFIALAALKHPALAWLLFADAALQVFDIAIPLSHGLTQFPVVPLALLGLELAAGLTWSRASRAARAALA
jgi:hypothetical protein